MLFWPPHLNLCILYTLCLPQDCGMEIFFFYLQVLSGLVFHQKFISEKSHDNIFGYRCCDFSVVCIFEFICFL